MHTFHWYAAYTYPRHEKSVAEHFRLREIENFLPLYHHVTRWKNGMKMDLELPLFPGYVFVRINLGGRLRVLETPSVASLVGFGGQPAPLPDQEIAVLQAGLAAMSAEPHPFLAVGARVRVKFGPLAGLEGFLVQKKNQTRFVLSLNLIMQAIAVEVDAADVEPISPCALTPTMTPPRLSGWGRA